jgi:trehalose/maltose hydrolase-like predicted phosphorylase/cell division protein FtsB
MISRTIFFASLLGCAILTGCDGSEDSPQPSQSTFAELAASTETIRTLQQQIAALQAQNAELINANERKVAALQITIDDLNKRVSGLPTTAEANGLRKQVSELQGEASNLKKQIDVTKTEIKDLTDKIAAIPAGETVESLVTALTVAKNSLDAMTLKVMGLEGKVALLEALVPPVVDATKPPLPPAENLASWRIVNRDFNETFTHQPFVSNGYIGLRLPASGQGYWRGSKNPDSLSGYPDYGPGRFTSAMVENFYSDNQIYLATLPNWSSLTIRNAKDGTFFDPNALTPEQVSSYEQVVDMRKGIVTTSLVWLAPNDKKVKLKWTAFAHRTNKHLGVIRLEITPLKWSGDISVRSYLDLNGVQKADNINQNWSDTNILGAQASVRTPGTGFKATTAFKMAVPENIGQAHAWEGDAKVSGLFWEFSPVVNQTYVFTKYVGIATSVDDELIDKLGRNIPQTFSNDDKTVNEAADGVANAAKQTGYTELLKSHIDAWEALWTKSSVTIENERLQKVINSAQYELLSSTYEGAKASIPAGGLVGTGYGGMIFWDAETFMYPYLLLTHPELAKTVVDYRFATLERARGNVTHSSFNVDRGTKPYRGTYFPWVSGTGNIGGEGSDERNRRQIHLQADIALAQYQYYAATGDLAFLKNQAWPILKGIADFYVTRGEFNADKTKFHLNVVTAPDEYAENKNDEAFTNGSAIKAFELAIKVAEQLNEAVPEEWRAVLSTIVKPQVDPVTKVHIQYDGFNPANSNNKIKQADVVLLTYPIEYPMTAQQSANDLDYYAKAADRDGPSMTDAIHAVIAAQLGRCDFGHFLTKSYDVALGPYEQFNETRVLGPSAGQMAPANVFLTGAGGFLQATGMGMTGYRFRDDRIVLKPTLPDPVEGQLAKRAYFKGLKWQGREFNVDIGETDTWVILTKGDTAKVQTTDDANVLVNLKLGEPLKIATRKAQQSDGKPCAQPAPELMHLR